MLKKLLHIASQKLSKMDQTINGSDPRFVSYKENGKDKAIEHIDLNSQHCHSYIGKMKNDGEGTYSDEVIIGLITYFFDNTKKGDKVVIELANKVSELLNGSENLEGYMQYHQQKEHILSLAKQVDKKRLTDLEIVDIQDNNKRLFDLLQHQGISGLSKESVEMNLSKDFDSLDIAKILYYVAEHDASYKEEIQNLKSETLKAISGPSDYYGLIEMAIRINALLHGITLQGGVARQKKYDALLLKHINPYIQDFPLLDPFKKFCWERLGNDTFKGIYFDTAGSEKLVIKQQAKKQIQTSTKNALLLALGLSLGVTGAMLGNQYISTQNKKKATQETIKEIFENKHVYRVADMAAGEHLGEDKIEQINSYVNNIYNRFVFRYGGIGKMDEVAFKAKIIDCLNDQKVLNVLSRCGGGDDGIVSEDKVIDEYLIPRNIGEFTIAGISTMPYTQYMKYTQSFVNTILLAEDWNQKLSTKIPGRKWEMDTHVLADDLGDYSPKYQGWYGSFNYKYGLAQVEKNGKMYILGSSGCVFDDDDKKNQQYELSTERGREFAIDFLKQTYPVINELLDQYLLRYDSWDSNSGDLQGYYKNKLSPEVELLLLRDFLSKGLLQKITQKQTDALVIYIDEFVFQHQQVLKSLSHDGQNPLLLPNGYLTEYEDALQNALKYDTTIPQKYTRLPVGTWHNEKASYVVSPLGRYRTSDGKLYRVGSVRIEGKRYLFAQEENSPYANQQEYGIREGREVAQDYFKTKSDFLQKQTRAQKSKNTSAR